jgi:myo-inositol-1(or 4)-monophosphatase
LRSLMPGMVPRHGFASGMLNADMPVKADSAHPFAGPRRPLGAEEERWLACAAHMAAAGKKAAQPLYGTASGRVLLGQGAGGDRTLEIDRACEAAIHTVLESEAPSPYLLVSEESGVSGPGDASWRVVVDPLDGSLNAKRGLEPFGASIAVARGETLGDVTIGYVEDYSRPRCFAAVKGAGLLRAGDPGGSAPGAVLPDHCRFESDLVEIVLLEAGRPDRHHFQYHDLSAMGAAGRSREMRIRQIGSLALSLCYVAVGVADILVGAVRSRSVDLAAGLLILSEAGGGVATLTEEDIWAQPLDLEKRCAFVAWRAGLDKAEVISGWRALRQTLLVHS